MDSRYQKSSLWNQITVYLLYFFTSPWKILICQHQPSLCEEGNNTLKKIKFLNRTLVTYDDFWLKALWLSILLKTFSQQESLPVACVWSTLCLLFLYLWGPLPHRQPTFIPGLSQVLGAIALPHTSSTAWSHSWQKSDLWAHQGD